MRESLVRRARSSALGAILLICLAAKMQAGSIPVYNTNNALAGSLRQAIQDAVPGDTIVFRIPTSDPRYFAFSQTYFIPLTSDQLLVDKPLTIDTEGQKIFLQRSTSGGTPAFRIFMVTASGVTISGVTISNGNGAAPDGLAGGGIRNSGTLTVRNCTLQNNNGSGYGGGIYNAEGGTLTVLNSTLNDNAASYGGGICNFGGSVTVVNCTISGNTANTQSGGGIYQSGTALIVTNSTITGNTSGFRGGGIHAAGPARVGSTIIAGNSTTSGATSVDVSGNFVSDGYNFIGVFNNQATGFGNSGSHDQVGTTASPGNPNLGPLQDNGGPTATRRPLPGSPVIDQGKRGLDGNGQQLNADQRGSPRPVDLAVLNAVGGDASDIGAVENGTTQSGPAFTVTSTAERDDGSCSTDECTLLEALNATNANADANTISFAPGVIGGIATDLLTPTGLTISSPVTINGPGARLLTISGEGLARIFRVTSQNVIIAGLTFDSGARSGDNGGAVANSGGLTLRDCTISSSIAAGSGLGGGVYNAAGATLDLVRCTFLGNQAGQFGGGVYSDGILNATNCTFFNNSAVRGGGVISRAVGGAAIMTLRNCTVTGNSATDGVNMAGFGGGGVYAEGSAQQHFLSNCLIAGNSSTNDPDLRGNYTSQGHNLIARLGDSVGLTNGVNSDQVGTVASPLDPQLAAFGNYGGPTDTTALLASSPAINAGDNALAPSTDQRGYPRIGTSDIGAFEFRSGLLRITKLQRNGNDLVLGFAEGVVGSAYRFEQTYDLAPASWQQIPGASDYTPAQTGAFEFIFHGAAALPANQSKIFYRVRLLP